MAIPWTVGLALAGGLAIPAPAQPTTMATTMPSDSSVSVQPSQGESKIGSEVKSWFQPRTEEQYFSPFEIMNPSHIRPDMPLEIGQIDDLHLNLGFQSEGRLQVLQQEHVFIKGVNKPGLNPGFQTPFANLSLLASIPDKLDVYFDLYIASRPHPNQMYAHEGYMLFKGLPAPFDNSPAGRIFDYINVKAGGFDIDFGDGNYNRSNAGFVQRNPLIGNPLVDPNVEEIGGEVYSIKGPIYWLVGAGGGTTTEHFDYGAGASGHAKVWGYPLPDLRTSASFYYADLSGSANANEHSNLFAGSRSGGAYSALFAGGDAPGQILPMRGERIMAVQGDVTWNHWPWEMYANLGWTQDSDMNGPAPGNPAERWLYGGIGPVYHITPAWYLAGRYSCAIAGAVNGVATDGWADRIQVGTGYWLSRNILAKVEYVYQQFHGFESNTGVVSGVDASRSPNFSGVVMEISFGF